MPFQGRLRLKTEVLSGEVIEIIAEQFCIPATDTGAAAGHQVFDAC